MSPPKSSTKGWLADIETVLRAPTGDLRALAALGGADPRTLYIGVSLDGVDVRGQDLTGMVFTHFDRSKLIIDETTRVDPPYQVETPSASASGALVYMAEKLFWDQYTRSKQPALKQAQVFAPYDVEGFVEACRRFDGPKLAIGTTRVGRTENFDGLLREGVVLVLHRSANEKAHGEKAHGLDRDFPRYAHGPVMIVPAIQLRNPVGGGYAYGLPAGVRSAVEFCTANWEAVRRFVHAHPQTVFLRAKGSGQDALNDAWAQLFGRVAELGLSGVEGRRFHWPGRTTPHALPNLDETLFPRFAPLRMEVPYERPNFDAALLLAEPKRTGVDLHYEAPATIATLFERLGWSVAPEGKKRPAYDLSIRGRHVALTVDCKFKTRPREPAIFRADALDAVSFDAVKHLVINEPSEPSDILDRLVRTGALSVSMRDIRAFEADAPNIWPLIALQASRVFKSGDLLGRAQYISLLLRAAVRHIGVKLEDPDRFMAIIRDQEPGLGYRFTPSSIRFIGNELRCLVKIESVVGNVVTMVTALRLAINPDGPYLEEVPPRVAA